MTGTPEDGAIITARESTADHTKSCREMVPLSEWCYEDELMLNNSFFGGWVGGGVVVLPETKFRKLFYR